MLERIVGSYSDETPDLETVLSEVERRWDSPRPGRCRGGVIAGDTCIQTHTKTPTALLEDVAAAKQFVQSLPADLTRYGMSPYECRAALCWPVQPGHFYIEYEYQSENHFGGEREQLRFGFLFPDSLFDDSLVRGCFAALDIDPPLYQRQWPRCSSCREDPRAFRSSPSRSGAATRMGADCDSTRRTHSTVSIKMTSE